MQMTKTSSSRTESIMIATTAVAILVGVALLTSSHAGNASADSATGIAQRDTVARGELAAIATSVNYQLYLPSSLPAGVTYDVVNWDDRHPEYGVGIFFAGPTSPHRALRPLPRRASIRRPTADGSAASPTMPLGLVLLLLLKWPWTWKLSVVGMWAFLAWNRWRTF